ncbi:carbohydrate kinase [candidate division KSB1 bacterium]
MNKDLIVDIGEILWDIYPDGKYLGGAVSNAVFHLKQLGYNPVIVSRIGKDEPGEKILSIMKEHGLDTKYIQIDQEKKTGTVGIKLKKDGVPVFKCMQNASFDYLEWTAELEELSGKAGVVIFGSFAQRNQISRDTIFRFIENCKNAVKVCDINLRQNTYKDTKLISRLCNLSDILKLNDTEFSVIKKNFKKEPESEPDFINRFIDEFNITILLVTLGDKGCAVFTKNECHYEPGNVIEAVDTTGSGDAFTAGFISGFIQKRSVRESAGFANRLAAYIAAIKGATPKFTAEDLNNFSSFRKGKKYSRKFIKLTETKLFKDKT